MKHNVKVYQIVLTEEKRTIKKETMLARTMVGIMPTEEDFNNLYDNVMTFTKESEIENVMEFCEFCFSALNSENLAHFELEDIVQNYPRRSLSVGDILEVNGELYIVKIMGFGKFPEETSSVDIFTSMLSGN